MFDQTAIAGCQRGLLHFSLLDGGDVDQGPLNGGGAIFEDIEEDVLENIHRPTVLVFEGKLVVDQLLSPKQILQEAITVSSRWIDGVGLRPEQFIPVGIPQDPR